MFSLTQRVAAFNAIYSKWPASHLAIVQEQKRDVMYGRWLIGNDYRNPSQYYGSYPAGYLARLAALFGDVPLLHPNGAWTTLHVFSGSLGSGAYNRCDSMKSCEFPCDVLDLPTLWANVEWRYKLIMADPPYAKADAAKYGTPMIHRGKVLRALAQIAEPGCLLAWLDTCWPMHRKAEWRTVGRIVITRSTNHRTRDLTIFERTAA
jgi:hypothetical protein